MSRGEKFGLVLLALGFASLFTLAGAESKVGFETVTRDGILAVTSQRNLTDQELEAFEREYARKNGGKRLEFVVRDRSFAVYKTP